MRRTTSRTVLGAVAVVTVLALGVGCTSGGEDPEPTDGGSSTSSTGEPEPEGLTSEDLSAELLAAGEQAADAEPLGSATAAVPGGNGELTVDVLAVQRNEASTTVVMRWTGTDGVNVSQRTPWYDSPRNRGGSRNLYLVEPTVSKSRYLPLSFDQTQQIAGIQCACPDLTMKLGGSEGVYLTATYAALPPEATTVDLMANDGWLTITGLPVGD